MDTLITDRLNALFGADAPAKLQIITSCTGEKASINKYQTLPAEKLYRGQQHRLLMAGVSRYRAVASLTLNVVSAKFGLVAGGFHLPNYDETFSGLGKAEIQARASGVALPGAVEKALNSHYDLIIVLLGRDYLTACQLANSEMTGPGRVVFLGGKSIGALLPSGRNVEHALVEPDDKRIFGAGEIALKGAIAGSYLKHLTDKQVSTSSSAAGK